MITGPLRTAATSEALTIEEFEAQHRKLALVEASPGPVIVVHRLEGVVTGISIHPPAGIIQAGLHLQSPIQLT